MLPSSRMQQLVLPLQLPACVLTLALGFRFRADLKPGSLPKPLNPKSCHVVVFEGIGIREAKLKTLAETGLKAASS